MAAPTTTDEWSIGVRRVYDAPRPQDGHRILVDRCWSEPLPETGTRIDEWCRNIAPSTELAAWYGQNPDRFSVFREQYLSELDNRVHARAMAILRTRTGAGLTLLTAAPDLRLSHARVLAERLSWGRAILGPTITRIHLDVAT